MGKKVVVLVDGQNLYYNLHDIKLLEKEVNWTALFNSMVSEGDELVRTYWFRPAKIQDTFLTEEKITLGLVYKKYRTHLLHYQNKEYDKIPDTIKAKVEAEVKEALEWVEKQRKKFADLEYAYDQLCLMHDDIEIVKTGVVKISPQKQVYIGEKGVDISLAVKMISLSVARKCDTIILVSGDYDYSEAVRYVKENMTKIHVVKFHKGYPPKSRSMSRDLSILADKVIDIYEADLKTKFKME